MANRKAKIAKTNLHRLSARCAAGTEKRAGATKDKYPNAERRGSLVKP
jgi:hypothetical protein